MNKKPLVVLISLLLAGCGGGEVKNFVDFNGKYVGLHDNGDATTVIYQDRFFYTMYNTKDKALPLAFEYGTLTIKDATTEGTGWLFSNSKEKPLSMTMKATYWAGIFSAKSDYAGTERNVTSASFPGFNVPAVVKDIAGTMRGTFLQSSETKTPGTEKGTLTITQDGKVNGEMTTCKFTGDVKPLALNGTDVSRGNMFEISLAFPADPACPVSAKTITGILLPRSDNANKSDVMIKYDPPVGGLMFYSER